MEVQAPQGGNAHAGGSRRLKPAVQPRRGPEEAQRKAGLLGRKIQPRRARRKNGIDGKRRSVDASIGTCISAPPNQFISSSVPSVSVAGLIGISRRTDPPDSAATAKPACKRDLRSALTGRTEVAHALSDYLLPDLAFPTRHATLSGASVDAQFVAEVAGFAVVTGEVP